jgi:hypothetical protein
LRRKTSEQKLKAFQSTHFPIKVDLLSWEPPIKYLNARTLSRDDTLHTKRFIKGRQQFSVVMPKARIQRRSEIDWVKRQPEEGSRPQSDAVSPALALVEEKSTPAVRLPASKDKLTGSAPSTRPSTADASAKTGSVQQSIEVTTAPSTDALFEAPSPKEDAATSAPAPVPVQVPASNKEAPFYHSTSTANPAATDSAADRPMLVTGELGGDIVQMGPRESLAAPGADASASTSRPTVSHDPRIQTRQRD